MAAKPRGKPFKKGGDPRQNKGRQRKGIIQLRDILVPILLEPDKETRKQNIIAIAYKLVDLAKSGKMDAIEELFNRVYGKVTDKLEMTEKQSSYVEAIHSWIEALKDDDEKAQP